MILRKRLKVLPAMDDGSGIDFRDAFEDSGFEFAQRLHSDMPQKGSGHFAEQRLDDIEP